MNQEGGNEIAVIGLAGRFPGASSVDELWSNLCAGVESISVFSEDELNAAGISAELLRLPNYVRAKGVLVDVDLFDYGFFTIGARIAQVMDPQHRIFLECSWEALESAGYDAERFSGAVGVFAGCGLNSYFFQCVAPNFQLVASLGELQTTLVNDKDFLATQVSYKLGLRGPSVTVQTACSTSLVAVHLACQSLLMGECDVALAGGVSVKFPHQAGYLYQPESILSPDGHCRPFDADANGTVNGSGAGVVVLRRLADALAAGDTVLAVIKGSAVNNDGSQKAGFTAPSLDGQAKVIAEAMAVAGVEPESISFVEAHGTGTAVGDPIEVAALSQAFAATAKTDRKGFCALGSIKGNLGHLDAASGIAGLIKAVLALRYGKLPPSLHFERPNPAIDLAASPFFVNDRLAEWPTDRGLLRAGVSSFGLGGTNAHVVLEEAPLAAPTTPPVRALQLLVLSARTATALERMAGRLAEYMRQGSDPSEMPTDLPEIAFTLQTGRKVFEYRRTLVCHDREEAAAALSAGIGRTLLDSARNRPVIFLFPGQGEQRIGMGAGLYAAEPVFHTEVDRACDLLKPQLGFDLRDVLFPAPAAAEEMALRLTQTAVAQPALFVVEHALAQLWMSWGIVPQATIGHSLGEYVAACLGGALSLADALALVAFRGQLMQSVSPGAMLAVRLTPEAVRKKLAEPMGEALALAAVNGAERCVVSGPFDAILALEGDLSSDGVPCRRLETSHAFHSAMMEPVLDAFRRRLEGARFGKVQIPWLSNLTGGWITQAEASDAAYWCAHLRQTVRFDDGVRELLGEDRIFLEVGPGAVLGNLVKQAAGKSAVPVLRSLPPVREGRSDEPTALLETLGDLWRHGARISWNAFHKGTRRRRVPLPTYPFEREKAWLEATTASPMKIPEPSVQNPVLISPVPASAARLPEILAGLSSVVGDLIGARPDQIDPSVPFLDVGVDSLLMIQASQAIHRRFGIKISLAELLEKYVTLQAVAEYLDREMPPSPVVAEPSAVADLPPAAEWPAPSDDGFPAPHTVSSEHLDRIINQQLELMARQLELLRGVGRAAARTPRPSEPAPIASPISLAAAPEMRHPFAAKPILTETPGTFTELQRRHLDDLISRHTRRTAESKRRTQMHRPHLAENRASVGFRMLWKEMVYPLIAERSEGARLWDVDGNEYVDIAMGFGVHLFGHSPAFVVEALDNQIRRGLQLGPQSDLAGEVAALIREATGMERATFANSGTEAVMTAMRVARAVTGRNRIALFNGSYHGSFDGTQVRRVVRGGEAHPVPSAPGVLPGMVEDLLVLEYDRPESLEEIRRQGRQLAAVLVEPVQSRRPELQPREFLLELRRITEESGTVLIFDDVIQGFRCHPGGSQAVFGVRADLAVYGKVVGGGLPIGVLAGKSKVMDAIDGGYWSFGDNSYPRADKTFFAGTFCKHPLSMAAALAVLRHLREEGPALQKRINDRTAALAAELNAFFSAERFPVEVVHFGSLFRFQFTRDQDLGDLFFFHLLGHGVYTWEGRTCFLSTAHTEKDLEILVEAVRRSVADLRAGGFFLPAESLPVPAEAVVERLPLTAAQRGIWSLCQLEPAASGAFNESIVCRFHGPIALRGLRHALQRVVDRHDVLRVTFDSDGEHQVVHSRILVGIPLIDLLALPLERRTMREADLVSGGQGREVFDLEHGPLLRARLFHFEPHRHLLDLTVHHLVTDGWSLGLLLSEIRQLYVAELQGAVVELPAPTPFRWYVELQDQRLGSADHEHVEAYWLARFAGAIPELNLPCDLPRPSVKSYRGARLSRQIGDDALLTALRTLCRDQRCTLFMLLLSAFQALVHHLTGVDDLVVGITLAEQPSLDSQTLMGYCLNVLPLRVRVEVDLPFRELLARTRHRLAEAQGNQAYDIARLVKKLELRRDRSRSPIFSVGFNHERGEVWHAPGGLRVEQVSSPNVAAQLDLSWMTVEMSGSLTVHCIYSTDLFVEERVVGWIEIYERLLGIVVREPDIRLNDLGKILIRQAAEKLERDREVRRSSSLSKLRRTERKPLVSAQGS